jgi:hypothetical protein
LGTLGALRLGGRLALTLGIGHKMSAIDEKIIELSKKKVLLLIIGACAFVALGAWLLLLDEATIQSLRRFNSPVFVHGVGLVSVVFFGLCGVLGIKKLVDKKPGLVFNSSGIVDNSSGVSAGLIPWTEIMGAEIFEIYKQKVLVIKVKNPQNYVERGNWLKQALNKLNCKMCGSPIAITSNALKISFSELLSVFSQYQERYGNA